MDVEHVTDRAVFNRTMLGFSWLLVIAIGLMPLAEAFLNRWPSITMPATIVFLVSMISGVRLRHRGPWVGVVLHIYSQIAIWLSLFAMSRAVVLAAFSH